MSIESDALLDRADRIYESGLAREIVQYIVGVMGTCDVPRSDVAEVLAALEVVRGLDLGGGE